VRARRASWRGIADLVRSAPAAVAALAGVHIVEGLAPAVAVGASATLLDQAPAAATSDAARRATIAALVVVAGSLVFARLASACSSMLHYLTSQRFSATVDRLRMEAATSLEGLAQFDDAKLADRLQASQWATQAATLVNYGGYLLRWASQAAGSAFVAARIGWWVPVLILVTPVPGAIVAWRHIGAQKALRTEQLASFRQANYHAELAVGLQPARELRLFDLRSWILDRQDRMWRRAMGAVLADMRRQVRHELMASAGKTAVAAIPFVVAYQRFVNGTLSAGDFAAGTMALAAFLATMRWLESFPAEVRAAAQFLPDLYAIVDLPKDDPMFSGTGRPPAVPEQGIRFEGVRFTYPGTEHPVLDGFDLWLPAGTSLALVGENGAGKSTVVKLLCRFYDPDAGRITVDGVDLRELDLWEWRRRMAVVFQDFVHLPLSAAVNVGIGCVNRLDDRGLLALAAEEAGAAGLVDSLEHGWDTVLAREFDGVDRSGGEWQRIALARALVARHGRGASVLVLDEPTAALDVRLEHDLYQRFAALTAGLTTLLISHRFSTVRMADRVAVLDAGRIVETGTHEQLVGLGGQYAGLYALQAGRFA
jgi:ATP-binding cassette subfamily B protein